MAHKPAWFIDGKVFVTFAETVGINKDGETLYVVDPSTGKRTEVVDDRVSADIEALLVNPSDVRSQTARMVPADEFTLAVPAYYDDRLTQGLDQLMALPEFADFEVRTLGELVEVGALTQRAGHGSPSADLRQGEIPYIKVSDVRAGQININPSNMVPRVVAERFWRSTDSGLKPFDLITPIRASKNIGEFALLMPGQEQVVLTKEMLILRAAADSHADNYFLFWALSLRAVREQWKRIVFMQTNRDDVGDRYLEIKIPWPTTEAAGKKASQDFREYYTGVEALRTKFVVALQQHDRHFVFLGLSAEAPSSDPT
ncbi:hypothetical protein [Pedococcus bigeumensis]|uniref:Uncharacterized protein n=1 Tax=Pedococcus bigeumensis TaxID=433644 RepID=A0A502CQQ6_9MICO|nr:hypothetical protein [Pedococcus bigeumensis]TPG14031.1 hypothetical protein EAH86_17655 [Pedococcus bigeumensis]